MPKALHHARRWIACSGLVLCAAAVAPAHADDIDSLKGQFTFNWFTEPGSTKCAAVGDELLAQFKSDAFKCDLTVITNTASGEPARVCTKGSEAEYMVFATEKSCESERSAQESNSE
ncbi:MAG: hypothetical protein IKE66_11240 [Hyphomicrobium sp.]|nr:hypothetical protein [Hyphomicrobium sp.]